MENLDTIEWDPPSFASNCDREKYESLVFNGDLDDLLDVEIELKIANTQDERNLWVFLIEATSSHKLKSSQPGRNFRLFVLDKKSGKYLGIIGMNSDFYSLTKRDKRIQWTQATRKKGNLQFTMSAGAVVPMYPFGTNFQGGKLITACIFSKQMSEIYESRYNATRYPVLLSYMVTSLHGKSIQYDKIICRDIDLERDIETTKLFEDAGRTFAHISYNAYMSDQALVRPTKLSKTIFNLEYLGNTQGSFLSNHVPQWLYNDIKTYLNDAGITIVSPSYSLRKEKHLNRAIKMVGLQKKDLQERFGVGRGVYYGFIYPRSNELLIDDTLMQKDITEIRGYGCSPDSLLDISTIFKWWFNTVDFNDIGTL